MHRAYVIGLLAIAASAPLASQPATTRVSAESGPMSIDRTTQTEDVKFETERNDRMTVPVLLSGTGPYRFLVDTGADRTAISTEIAAQLRLSPGEKASLHSVAGVTRVTTATVPSLQLTRKPVRIVDAPLLQRANMGADGILGVDSLRSQRVMFDFEAKTMSIVPAATPDFRDEEGTIVVRALRRNGRLVVTDALANKRPLTVVLDTGAQLSVGNAALRRQLEADNSIVSERQVELSSVAGEKLLGDILLIRELNIGGVKMRDLGVIFVPAHAFKQMKLENRPAMLLGMNAMRAFKKVSIDFARRKMRVVLPESGEADLRVASPLDRAAWTRGGR
jgi:predicted aspartyl protease